MKKLPPYGRSVIPDGHIYVFAGYHHQAEPYLKHKAPNTIGFFPWEDSESYFWPVEDREIILCHWLLPDDDWIQDLLVTLYFSGCKIIATYCFPQCSTRLYKRS